MGKVPAGGLHLPLPGSLRPQVSAKQGGRRRNRADRSRLSLWVPRTVTLRLISDFATNRPGGLHPVARAA